MKREEDKRNRRFTMSLTHAEYDALIEAAKETHETVIAYCRRAAFLEIERQKSKKLG